ncbi:MAG TPA: hypothetical protein VF810_04475 [Patescibacteria group bacterium]
MDLHKLRTLIDRNILLDIDQDNPHELLINYKPGDNDCWFKFNSANFPTEKELAAAIKAEVDKKLS